MTGRVLYGCAVICMMFAIYSFGGISIGLAFGLMIAAVSFAAAGALLSTVHEIRDMMRKQISDDVTTTTDGPEEPPENIR